MAKDERADLPPSMAGTGGYKALRADGAEAAFYARLVSPDARRRQVLDATIPARHGRAFTVRRGQILRIACIEGPQVADVIAFNLEDPSERFWAARSRVIHGAHLGVGDRLWSCPPRTRPMLTVIADSLAHAPLPHGARSHDLLFCRCDARHYEIANGVSGARNCQDNLAEAIRPFGLGHGDVHDPFNVFMTTGLNDEGRPFYLPCDAVRGDYVEFFAEIDCLVAASACPGGSSGALSRALGVTVFQPD